MSTTANDNPLSLENLLEARKQARRAIELANANLKRAQEWDALISNRIHKICIAAARNAGSLRQDFRDSTPTLPPPDTPPPDGVTVINVKHLQDLRGRVFAGNR